MLTGRQVFTEKLSGFGRMKSIRDKPKLSGIFSYLTVIFAMLFSFIVIPLALSLLYYYFSFGVPERTEYLISSAIVFTVLVIILIPGIRNRTVYVLSGKK